MADNTPIKLRNKIIYSIYVRNHTSEGTFKSIIPDLDRIKSLGTDIIWFMPIHPIGQKCKKGSLGCPYSIYDYRVVNPEYGTMDDFRELVDEIHSRGMKCMIDVVYNHTSVDSVLTQEHPEWFYHSENGEIIARIADWSDVRDLDYGNSALWDYQCETLRRWANIVDGFRCDVASLVPVDFWKRARSEIASIKPNFIWLAESVDPGFIVYLRNIGYDAYSDGEVYKAFDITYDYDIKNFFFDYAEGKIPLSRYLFELNRQESTYPKNYVKLRYLENHDMPRAAHTFPDIKRLQSWTAFMFFQKGTALLYGGQEYADTNTPSLFDIDKVNRNTGTDLSPLIKNLSRIKKLPIAASGAYKLTDADNDIVYGEYKSGENILIGVFSLKNKTENVRVSLPDGEYKNYVDNSSVTVSNGQVICDRPIIIYK